MSNILSAVMGQVNFLVGDVPGNTKKIIGSVQAALERGPVDVIVFPELALTGYPPEDLLLRSDLYKQIEQAIAELLQENFPCHVIFGFPNKTESGLFNSAAIIQRDQIIAIYNKQHLPNYGVFDEKRYFSNGSKPCVIEVKGFKLGIEICEDLWRVGPTEQLKQLQVDAILSLNASPYDFHKSTEREQIIAARIQEVAVPILYIHCLGGQDELVFDGGSFVMDAAGVKQIQADFFQEALIPVQLTKSGEEIKLHSDVNKPELSQEQHIYEALKYAVKDYVEKNNFPGIVLGLSGGIDSALVLTIAVDALGADRVEAILMPSRYTAKMSIEDAESLAQNCNVQHRTISIEPTFKSFLTSLEGEFAGLAVDQTEENIQARCRGILLMAISNKKGSLVLTTGNKSEYAVGYATLYGDMSGGFAPLKDVPKTLVYALAKYRNSLGPVIPERIITRPPSAELAPDQKDEDSLPPYDILDQILEAYVELDQSLDEIVAHGFDHDTVKKVINLVVCNEYKRRQAAPGVKITRRAFGRERRYPITSGFKTQ